MRRHLTSSAVLLAVIGMIAIAYPFVSGSHSQYTLYFILGGVLALSASSVLFPIARKKEFVAYSPAKDESKGKDGCDDCDCGHKH